MWVEHDCPFTRGERILIGAFGIDGSDKSTISAALPAILVAEVGLVAGAVGETFCICGPDEDHLALKFHPDGLPVFALLTTRFKRLAKRLDDAGFTQRSRSRR